MLHRRHKLGPSLSSLEVSNCDESSPKLAFMRAHARLTPSQRIRCASSIESPFDSSDFPYLPILQLKPFQFYPMKH
jgi:hypothetical protein